MKRPYISMEADGTCWSDDALICPYCQKPQTDLFEISGAYTENGGNADCQSCGKAFSFSTSISYAWTSRRNKQLEGN